LKLPNIYEITNINNGFDKETNKSILHKRTFEKYVEEGNIFHDADQIKEILYNIQINDKCFIKIEALLKYKNNSGYDKGQIT